MPELRPLLAAAAAASALLLAPRAEASHFRYGNITWTRPDPVNQPRTVQFQVTTAWRDGYPDLTTLTFGDGASYASGGGIDIGVGVDGLGLTHHYFRYITQHTYPNNGQDQFKATISSCCRSGGGLNSANASFSIAAQIDLGANKTGNPIGLVPAFVSLQTGGVRTQLIPAMDPDGAPVTCRFATPAEAGDAAIQMPPKIPATGAAPTLTPSQNPLGCLLTWDTTGAVAGQRYTVVVVAESTNPVSGLKSSAVNDYAVEMVASPPPTCTGGGLFTIPMGTSFFTALTGVDKAGGVNLTLATLFENGSLLPTSGTAASPFAAQFKWAPGPGDEGHHLATAIFADQKHATSYCSLELFVQACPSYGQACSVGVGACQNAGILQCTGPDNAAECSAKAGSPTPELCDGADNDCDGDVDEGDPQGGAACATMLTGACSEGLTSCGPGGQLQCIPDVAPGSLPETCNGQDDDCNGVIDDGFAVGASCSAGVGACKVDGQIACDGNGGAACGAVAGTPGAEVCDGVDNDCDGELDEGCCKSDSECGAIDSGQICDVASGACGPGCRGAMGNGCPAGQVCSSVDATPGTCSDATTSSSTATGSGGAGGAGGSAGEGGATTGTSGGGGATSASSSTSSTSATTSSGGTGGAASDDPEEITISGCSCSLAFQASKARPSPGWLLFGALALARRARRRMDVRGRRT